MLRKPASRLIWGIGAAAFSVALTALPSSAATSSAVPRIVEQAAVANARAMQGMLVHERHMIIAVSAGPIRYSEQNDAVLLMANGLYQRLRYIRVIENGKSLDADAIAQRDAKTNRELDRGDGAFKQPFDQRFLQDYAYRTDASCACNADTVAVRFRSLVRDDTHGDGVMQIDRTTGRVLDVSYTPDVLPAHASSCTTTESFAQVLPDVWTIVRIERSYHGHVAFFRGGGDVIETLDHFKAVPSAQAGLSYLEDVTQTSSLR